MDIEKLKQDWQPERFIWLRAVQVRTELLPGEKSSDLERPGNYKTCPCLQKSTWNFELLTESHLNDIVNFLDLKDIVSGDSFVRYGLTWRRESKE